MTKTSKKICTTRTLPYYSTLQKSLLRLIRRNAVESRKTGHHSDETAKASAE